MEESKRVQQPTTSATAYSVLYANASNMGKARLPIKLNPLVVSFPLLGTIIKT